MQGAFLQIANLDNYNLSVELDLFENISINFSDMTNKGYDFYTSFTLKLSPSDFLKYVAYLQNAKRKLIKKDKKNEND